MPQGNFHIRAEDVQWNEKSINPLREGHIHVYKANLRPSKDDVNRFSAFLNHEERNRANGFYFKKDKDSFIKARGTLRLVLAKYLDMQAQDIIFTYNKFGKPRVEGTSIEFNISHSGEYALFAFSNGPELGADVEVIKPKINYERLVSRFFSPKEATLILEIEESQRASYFFKCWTRKEALIKACGEGMNMPLDCFTVSVLDSDEVRLESLNYKSESHLNWSLRSFSMDNKAVSALAVNGEIKNVEFVDFEQVALRHYFTSKSKSLLGLN